jgi:ParB family chromosome partitioning protein
MAAKHKGLGRGLGALIKEMPADEESKPATASNTVAIEAIRRNPWQPRHEIGAEHLQELVQSVRDKGVLQPLLVRKIDDGYELIAGERRLTAAKEAGLDEVPAIVMEATDREALELALVENLQREDLNLIEEADGYRVLCEKFSMTQEQVAEHVGKARVTVTNVMRVLGLPEKVKELIAAGVLSAGHAKVLLSLPTVEEQEKMARRVVHDGLSVRALEKLIQKARRSPRTKKQETGAADIPDSHLQYLSDKLHQHFGTGVKITPCKTMADGKKVKGHIDIDFYSNDDLGRVLDILGLAEDL